MSRRLRRMAVVTVLVAVIPLASACTSGFNALVDKSYYPADGTSADAGNVAVRNALVVASADGTRGNLIAGIVAQGSPDRLVGLTFSGATSAKLIPAQTAGAATDSVLLPANTTVSIGNPGEAQIVLNGLKTPAGSWADLTLNFATAGSAQLQIPVVAPVGIYADYAPTAEVSSPSPSVQSSPSPSATP